MVKLTALKKKYNKKIEHAAGHSKKVWAAFQKRRRTLIRLSVVSVLLTLLSLAIVGGRLFYPFHVVIGVGIYILSFIPFGYRIYLSRDTWRTYQSYGMVGDFLKKEKRRFLFAVLFLLLVALFLWLRPLNDRPFAGFTDGQIISTVDDDVYRSVTAMDYLETTGNELLTILKNAENDSNATEDIHSAFTEFLAAVGYSESLTDTNRYFSAIPYRLWQQRIEAFLISYSLYAKKYELVHRIMVEVNGNEHHKTALNHEIEELGRGNVYAEMINRYYSLKTRVRLSGGYLYAKLFIGEGVGMSAAPSMLLGKAYDSYGYLASNFGTTVANASQVVSDSIEQQMFEAWFPIQKNVATAMGRAILSTRGKEGLIEDGDVALMQKKMVPGDIMLQRRNWHVSNVGIPGFWTHSALYTGTLDEMADYFASEFPYQGHESLPVLLAAEFPDVY